MTNAFARMLSSSKSKNDSQDMQSLPIRGKKPLSDNSQDAEISLQPLDNGFLVSVQPPREPATRIKHTPVDLVLVIDTSGSMDSSAPMPTSGSEREHTGLSILDLTKHAARTIIETLDMNDRLGIVTFGYDARIIQKLTNMTRGNKKSTVGRVEKLRSDGATNLWEGLRTGQELFDDVCQENPVQAVFVLTDGMPNHMCPRQGYVPKLKSILTGVRAQGNVPPSIHTFGFGYSLRSGLLQSIAEVGNGNYGFIPDAGMIGTVFVHAVANLFSTFATEATIVISAPPDIVLEEAGSNPVVEESEEGLVIPLGNLQYGQSRDVIVNNKSPPPYDAISTTATLTYHCGKEMKTNSSTVESDWESLENMVTELHPDLVEYHIGRAKTCTFLNSLFPKKKDGEHQAGKLTCETLEQHYNRLAELVLNIKASAGAETDLVQSLLQDLDGAELQGQVRIALKRQEDFTRWGQHYLPSLLHAHTRQICNSFKDPGPLQYGQDSPLFIRCRQELDDAFDNLPPPKPSIKPQKGQKLHSISHMSSYNRSSAPCFAAGMQVKLGEDKKETIPVQDLRSGMKVWTPVGRRKVMELIETTGEHLFEHGHSKSTGISVCRIGELVVTPWHPVCFDGKWVFPEASPKAEAAPSAKAVYSVLLEPSEDADAHAINISGILAVTLGHGIVGSTVEDVRAHAFFGDYIKIFQSVQNLPRSHSGTRLCLGLGRDAKTGLVKELIGAKTVQSKLSDDSSEGIV